MIILKTTYPCLIKTATDMCELDQNDRLEIDGEEFLFVYPQNAGLIPFYINLNSPVENEHLSVFKRQNDTILLLESPFALSVCEAHELSFGSKKCEVTYDGNTLGFKCAGKSLGYQVKHPQSQFKAFKIKNFACAQFDEDLYIFNVQTYKLSHLSGNITIEGDQIVVERQFEDSCKRQKNSKYNLKEDIVLEEENFLHTETQISPELAPYKLMESMKAKDVDFALSLLSEKLKKEVSSDQITQFFGNFSAFLPLSTTEFITISGKQKNYVKFNIANGKIDDIVVDNLI